MCRVVVLQIKLICFFFDVPVTVAFVVSYGPYFAHSRERLEELFAVSFTNVFVADVYYLYCVGMRLFDTD